jgi:hypothetical protein
VRISSTHSAIIMPMCELISPVTPAKRGLTSRSGAWRAYGERIAGEPVEP